MSDRTRSTHQRTQQASEQTAVAVAVERLPYHHSLQEKFGVDRATWRALVEAVFPAATTVEGVILALAYCKARGLDPMKRPVHVVPIYDKGRKRMVESVWPGIGEQRTTAFRTGQYAGCDECKFGPDVETQFSGTIGQDHNSRHVNISVHHPMWAQMTVFRMVKGERMPMPGPRVYWLETYARMGRTEVPNDMWQKRPYGQIEKCFDPETEILTDRGFQKLPSVTGRVLQVNEDGSLAPTDAVPFCQPYSGDMIKLHSRDMDFMVTPNHDMITTAGKIEAGTIYERAQAKPKFWAVRCAPGGNVDFAIRDDDIRLAAAFLADGSGRHRTFTIAVSRHHKHRILESLAPEAIKVIRSAGQEAIAVNGRVITARHDKLAYSFPRSRIAAISPVNKEISHETILRLSRRQARLLVDTWLTFDGNRNKKTGVRRLFTSRPEHADAFELAAIMAGMTVSPRKGRVSDISTKPNFMITVSDRSEIGLIRWGKPHSRSNGNMARRAGMEVVPNTSGEVWCVTVPSGKIVVRRNGFAMLSGNCAEAAALRRAFPEEVGNEPVAEEVGADSPPTIDMTGDGTTFDQMAPTQEPEPPAPTGGAFADPPPTRQERNAAAQKQPAAQKPARQPEAKAPPPREPEPPAGQFDDPQQTAAPAQQPPAAAQGDGFQAFLSAPDGTDLRPEPFTDPVAFARALKDAVQSRRDGVDIWDCNAPAVEEASEASAEAAAILDTLRQRMGMDDDGDAATGGVVNEPEPPPPAAAEPEPEDPARKSLEDRIADMQSCGTIHDLNAWNESMPVKRFAERMKVEKRADILKELSDAYYAKKASFAKG